jgi:hypothetical protein
MGERNAPLIFQKGVPMPVKKDNPRNTVQIQRLYSCTKGLYGIDAEGVVYVYQGKDHGWSSLNMDKMTNREVAQKFNLRPYNPNTAWDGFDDDIPF